MSGFRAAAALSLAACVPLSSAGAGDPGAPAPAPAGLDGRVGRSEVAPSAPTLRADSPIVALAVPGFDPAIVSLPLGATSRRPVLVATHGAGDRPEWQCEMWRDIVGDRAFVLCPRGKRIDPKVPHEEAAYYYPTHYAIEREVAAALASLRESYEPFVDTERAVYAGFSQGAMMGGLVVMRNPSQFPRAVLIEGSYGQGQWVQIMARTFRRGGGERVLFACGGGYCADRARQSAQRVEQAGAKGKVVQGSGGHTYGGGVGQAVKRAFDWVIEGDERWFLGGNARASAGAGSPAGATHSP